MVHPVTDIDHDLLINRAFIAYLRTDRDPTEPIFRNVVEHEGKFYVVLRTVDGVLAVYRVRNDGILKRLRRWPAELEEAAEDPLMSTTVEYLNKMPTTIPEGKILWHNRVKPTRHLGSRGFRAYLDDPDDDKYVKCDCGWGAELGDHYQW